jgi:hypothetical protein
MLGDGRKPFKAGETVVAVIQRNITTGEIATYMSQYLEYEPYGPSEVYEIRDALILSADRAGSQMSYIVRIAAEPEDVIRTLDRRHIWAAADAPWLSAYITAQRAKIRSQNEMSEEMETVRAPIYAKYNPIIAAKADQLKTAYEALVGATTPPPPKPRVKKTTP